jgi:putative copper resistance protein D
VLLVVGPPTPFRLLAHWVVEPTSAVLLLVSGVAYLAGVRRLRRRGRRWPPARTVAFCSGLAVAALATQSGLAAYDGVLFSLHVVQHLLLAMVAPPLLALGAPLTLALQAGPDRGRRRLRAALHSRAVVLFTHPVVAWVAFAGGLAVLYFSPLYELSLRNPLAHALTHGWFFASGCLFFWPVVGLDPLPRRLPHGFRLLWVVLALPFHALVGVALLTGRTVLASDYYEGLARTWGASPLADQRTGGGLLWLAGDLVGLAVLGVVVVQWMGHDQRMAAREDRRT